MILAGELVGAYLLGVVTLIVVAARYGQRIVMWGIRRQMAARLSAPSKLPEYVHPKP